MLRNLNQSSGGQRVCGTPKSGVLGSLIPATGDNGAGYTYNDLILPADNAKEICGRITTWPSSGTLFAYEDTSFEFSGAPDGSYSFAYQLYVDGVAVGSPASVALSVGLATAQFTVTTDDAVFVGNASPRITVTLAVTTDSPSFSINAAATSSAIFNALIDDAVFSGGVVVSGAPNQVSFSVTTDDAVFFWNVATAVSATISAITEDVTFSGGAFVSGAPASVSFTVTTDSAVFSGAATTGSFTGSISDADITRIVQAVLAALNATTIPVDTRKMNGSEVIGDGSEAQPWRGFGVQP